MYSRILLTFFFQVSKWVDMFGLLWLLKKGFWAYKIYYLWKILILNWNVSQINPKWCFHSHISSNGCCLARFYPLPISYRKQVVGRIWSTWFGVASVPSFFQRIWSPKKATFTAQKTGVFEDIFAQILSHSCLKKKSTKIV